MQQQVIADTGILVAIIDRNDQYHSWVTERLAKISPPLLPCEAVIAETWFLLSRVRNGRETLLSLLEQKQISVLS